MAAIKNIDDLEANKTRNLILGIILDAIGMLSYSVPFLAELSDLIWAPLSAYIMTKLYKGQSGKIAGVVSFIEEVLPFTDVVPTFTIMWFYTYVFKRR